MEGATMIQENSYGQLVKSWLFCYVISGRHKYNVIFGVGNNRYRTGVEQEPSGNPTWAEESVMYVLVCVLCIDGFIVFVNMRKVHTLWEYINLLQSLYIISEVIGKNVRNEVYNNIS